MTSEIEGCDCDACSGECPEMAVAGDSECLSCKHDRHPVTEEE
jgi:hypothetical protein